MQNDSIKHINNLRIKGLPADFRKKIKKARKKRGWGQRELGIRSGLPQPHISAIESGNVAPRFDTLLDIVRILDMDVVLVPRHLVPAVMSLIRADQEPESVEKPLYAIDEEAEADEEDREDAEDYEDADLKTGEDSSNAF